MDLRCLAPKWALPPPQARAKPGSRAWTPRSRQSCLFRMHALLGPEVQSKVSGKVTFVGRKNTLFAQPARFAHNSLVGGSSPSSPTTQSRATGEFLGACEIRRIGGGVRGRPVSETAHREPVRGFGPFVSASPKPGPGGPFGCFGGTHLQEAG